jgi:dTDP-glucose 4,6-dehydratase
MAYHNFHGLQTRIVEFLIPMDLRMRLDDGRALPAFMSQALKKKTLPFLVMAAKPVHFVM